MSRDSDRREFDDPTWHHLRERQDRLAEGNTKKSWAVSPPVEQPTHLVEVEYVRLKDVLALYSDAGGNLPQ